MRTPPSRVGVALYMILTLIIGIIAFLAWPFVAADALNPRHRQHIDLRDSINWLQATALGWSFIIGITLIAVLVLA